VTFTAGGDGALADSDDVKAVNGVYSVTVDTGTAKTNVPMPNTTPTAGYKFTEWTWSVTGDNITSDITATANFTHASYKVTLPNVDNVQVSASGDGIANTENGDIMATHGNEVKITVKVSAGTKVTAVTYKIGNGAEKSVVTDSDGIGTGDEGYTFTIPGADITGAISVNLTSNATYQVTFTASGNGTVNETTSVTKTFDVNHTIVDGDLPPVAGYAGYVIDTWSYTDADGQTVTGTPVGQTVTANKEYTVSFKYGTYDVTLPDGVSGIAANATYLSDLTFTPTADGKVIYSVSYTVNGTDGTKTAEKVTDDNGVYTGQYKISGNDITGDIDITVNYVDGTLAYISASAYAALENGTKIVIVKTDKMNGSKLSVKIDDNTSKEFYWSGAYSGYVAIVDAALTDAQLAVRLSVLTSGSAEELSYDGDINHSGTVTAADSGIINDILHMNDDEGAAGKTTVSYSVTDKRRLELDVNGDKKVSSADIIWVLEEAVHLSHTTSNSDTESTSDPEG
jgi:hypothetical protein